MHPWPTCSQFTLSPAQTSSCSRLILRPMGNSIRSDATHLQKYITCNVCVWCIRSAINLHICRNLLQASRPKPTVPPATQNQALQCLHTSNLRPTGQCKHCHPESATPRGDMLICSSCCQLWAKDCMCSPVHICGPRHESGSSSSS